jgi:hypothetical protein
MAIARLLRRNFVVPSYIRPSRDMLSIGTKDQYSTTRLLRRESSVAPLYSTPVSAKRRTCLAASITFCWDFRKGLKPSAFRMGLKSKQVSGVRFTQLTPSWTDWGDLDRRQQSSPVLKPLRTRLSSTPTVCKIRKKAGGASMLSQDLCASMRVTFQVKVQGVLSEQ